MALSTAMYTRCVSWYIPRWSYDMDVLRICEEGHDVDSALSALL
jgi:hypothetical protein